MSHLVWTNWWGRANIMCDCTHNICPFAQSLSIRSIQTVTSTAPCTVLSRCCSPCHHDPFPLFSATFTTGGVIAYISSSSSASSPESCHSDSSNGSYQSASPPRGSSPSQLGQVVDTSLASSGQNLPGTQRSGRSSSSAKCGITSKSGTLDYVYSFRFLLQRMREFWELDFSMEAEAEKVCSKDDVCSLVYCWGVFNKAHNECTILCLKTLEYASKIQNICMFLNVKRINIILILKQINTGLTVVWEMSNSG